MNYINFKSSSGIIIALTAASSIIDSCKYERKESKNPNIIIILADDLGHGDVEALNPESRIPTPNLNKLAREGLIFTDAHTPSGVCSPTRYGLLTGRYCWRTRLTSGVLWDYAGTLIEPDRKTIAGILQENGYYTGMVGKWHLGIDWKLFDETAADMITKETRYSDYSNIDFHSPVKRGINEYGFHYSFAIAGSANMTPFTYLENNKVTGLPEYTTEEVRQETGEWYGSEGHVAKGFRLEDNLPNCSAKAIEFIENAIRQYPEKPFFLYYPLVSPHTPVVPNEAFIGKSKAGAYGDFIVETDFYIGELMTKLKELGIDKNTMIIFTSDNGPENDRFRNMKTKGDMNTHGQKSQAPYRGWKRERWEGGHRVPFFLYWPGLISTGDKCSTTICLTDVMPTIAELTGTILPENSAEDGKSFYKAIIGKDRPESFHEAIVHHEGNGSFAIRMGRFKLIIDGPRTPSLLLDEQVKKSFMLFDVTNDIREESEISSFHPDVVQQMFEILKKYVREGRSV